MLLTTHLMDEADLLCDRIAVMAKGRVAAIGSQQRLKARFGVGYRVTLHLATPAAGTGAGAAAALLETAAAAAHAFMLASVARDARLLNRVGTTLAYALPGGASVDVAAVFAALNAARGTRRAGFVEFGLQQSTLEEAFVAIVEAADARAAAADGSHAVVNPLAAASDDAALVVNA